MVREVGVLGFRMVAAVGSQVQQTTVGEAVAECRQETESVTLALEIPTSCCYT